MFEVILHETNILCLYNDHSYKDLMRLYSKEKGDKVDI